MGKMTFLYLIKEYFILRKSGFFDDAFYLLHYPDVRIADVDPLWHFIRIGWKEGRNPSPFFDTTYYLESNPDVKQAGINPVIHYLKSGEKEGRNATGNLINNTPDIKRKVTHKNPIYRILKQYVSTSRFYDYAGLSIKMKYKSELKVSIIIPNYNGIRYLGECLKSLKRINFPRDQFEIIVVDNASTDGSVEFIKNNYPDIVLIEASSNLGFAGGCNLGIMHSKAEYIVLLNNDTEVDTNWLIELVKVADSDEKVGIVGSKLLFKNERNLIQNAGSYITDRGDGGDIGYRRSDFGQFDTSREVMAVCGASMLVKRNLIYKIGGFDEDFGSYYEDTDLCYRARLHGMKIVYTPKSIVYHVHAVTLGEWSPLFSFYVFRNKIFLHFKNSPLLFLLKITLLYFFQVYREITKGKNIRVHLRVLFSICRSSPKFLVKRFFVRLFIKRKKDSEILLRLTRSKSNIKSEKINKICIYNAYLPTMGGGESQTANMIGIMNNLFPTASIDLLYHNSEAYSYENIIGKDMVTLLENEFKIKMSNVRQRFVRLIDIRQNNISFLRKFINIINTQKLISITKDYDIFINNTYNSELPAKAKLNIYYCMFPSKPREYTNIIYRKIFARNFTNFLKSYHLFLANSNYTQKWIDNYWNVNSYVLYPPVKDPEIKNEVTKENTIINVGRFFAGGHNKKQDVMINAFIEMQKKGWAKGWSLILVGRRHNDYASEKFVESLENLIDGYPIQLHYDLSYDELITYLNKAKIYWHATGFGENIFLNPEKFEHFGLSTIEAMQYGVVPVVYNAGGQPEIVRHGENGFLWNTVDELVTLTHYLMKWEGLYQALSTTTSETVKIFNNEINRLWLKQFLSEFIIF